MCTMYCQATKCPANALESLRTWLQRESSRSAMTKGTSAQGQHNRKTHCLCVRCGKSSYPASASWGLFSKPCAASPRVDTEIRPGDPGSQEGSRFVHENQGCPQSRCVSKSFGECETPSSEAPRRRPSIASPVPRFHIRGLRRWPQWGSLHTE